MVSKSIPATSIPIVAALHVEFQVLPALFDRRVGKDRPEVTPQGLFGYDAADAADGNVPAGGRFVGNADADEQRIGGREAGRFCVESESFHLCQAFREIGERLYRSDGTGCRAERRLRATRFRRDGNRADVRRLWPFHV
jgi:hypothetical protein